LCHSLESFHKSPYRARIDATWEVLSMFSAPKQQEINHITIKLVVGIIALSLASLTSFFANSSITSISASYYEGGWSQSIFVGFLFAIAAFLLAYNEIGR